MTRFLTPEATILTYLENLRRAYTVFVILTCLWPNLGQLLIVTFSTSFCFSPITSNYSKNFYQRLFLTLSKQLYFMFILFRRQTLLLIPKPFVNLFKAKSYFLWKLLHLRSLPRPILRVHEESFKSLHLFFWFRFKLCSFLCIFVYVFFLVFMRYFRNFICRRVAIFYLPYLLHDCFLGVHGFDYRLIKLARFTSFNTGLALSIAITI